MKPFDRVGTYLVRALSAGVSKTKNGFPQYVLKLEAVQYYDATGELTGSKDAPGEPGYVQWDAFDDTYGDIGYFVTHGQNGRTLTGDILMQILKWDGDNFEALAGIDVSERLFLIRVEDSTWNNKTSRKIVWIDDPDTDPIRRIKSLDSSGLKALTAKFAGMSGGAPVAPAAASAPSAAPAAATPAAPAAPATPANPTKPSLAKPATASASASSTNAYPNVTDSDTAWAAICEDRPKGLTDDALASAWTSAIEFRTAQDGEDSINYGQLVADVLDDIRKESVAA